MSKNKNSESNMTFYMSKKMQEVIRADALKKDLSASHIARRVFGEYYKSELSDKK